MGATNGFQLILPVNWFSKQRKSSSAMHAANEKAWVASEKTEKVAEKAPPRPPPSSLKRDVENLQDADIVMDTIELGGDWLETLQCVLADSVGSF